MKDIPIPHRMRSLRRDSKGRVVPYFVKQDQESDPDFRVMDEAKRVTCSTDHLCWVCGGKMGVHKCFVTGPMCCINRTSAEPPSHYECALYSVQVCPFLTTPRMTRRESGLPDNVLEPDGIAIYRNPGVSAIWVTRSYYHISTGDAGFLFRMGPAERVEWYAEGRKATRDEIMQSINTGFPQLVKLAEEDGPKSIKELEKLYAEMLKLLPAA